MIMWRIKWKKIPHCRDISNIPVKAGFVVISLERKKTILSPLLN